MGQAETNLKILRIGVIQSGKVIEERLVRKRTTVTFGRDEKSTFVLGSKEVPPHWALFELKGNQYSLVFSDDMDGRVTIDKNPIHFSSLKSQGLVQKQGDRWRMPLNDSSRGRVQLGKDLTILFHFVAAPPIAAKPELPLAAKGGWVKSIEPVFTSVLTGSFLAHALFTILIFNVERPPPPSMEELQALIARVRPQEVEVPPPDDVPVDDTSNDDADKEDKGDKPKKKAPEKKADAAPGKKAPGKAGSAKAGKAHADAVRDQIANKGILAMIGSAGGAGDLGNVFGEGSVLDGVSTDVEGTAGVGIGGGGGVTRRGSKDGKGGGGGDAAGIDGLGTGGGGAVSAGGKKKTKIRPKVKTAQISDVDGTIDKKGVSRVLRGRQKMFQQCYESALKTNSKLKGKIVVEFTIGPRGRVIDARVVRDGLGSSKVSKCVTGALKRLRFPKPSDGEVTITNTFVFSPTS